MRPMIIFSVNANINPYEDLNRQARAIEVMVLHGHQFEIGVEIYKGTPTPVFLVGVAAFEDQALFNFLIEGRQARVVMVAQNHEVLVIRPNNVQHAGILVEIDEHLVKNHVWVLYTHEDGKFNTVASVKG